MKVARFSRTRPLLTVTEILSQGSAGPDGQVVTSIGSNTVSWGSNVANIWVNGTTKVLGPEVNFANGSNTTVTVDMVGAAASNTIRIHATGGSGNVATDTIWDAKGDLAVGTGANTAAILSAPFFDGSVLIRDTAKTTGLDWQSNNTTTSDPTVTDDVSGGWRVGSRWINTTTDTEYVNLDATAGAAVWASTTNLAGVSYGSNSTRVSEISSAGASASVARFDHIHDGIGTITASSSNTMQRGTWNLRPGAGIALNLSDTDGDGEFDTTTIVNTGSGGGGAPATAYDPIANNFGTPDTTFEFDTSSFTGLTSLSTTPDGEDANTSVVSHYYIKDNDSEFVGRYAAVTPPFTAITKLSDATLRANYSHAGLFCGVATPGKMVSVVARFGDGQFVITFTQTGPTDTGPGTPAVTDPPATPLVYPMYLGIKCSSSTDVSYYMSHTGHVWHAILLNHNNSMTVASVGIGIFVLGGGTGQTSAAFDYLRIWNSAKTFVL